MIAKLVFGFFSLLMVFTHPILVRARPIPMQSYQQLADQADVIVIADALPPEDVDYTGGLPNDRYQQMETKLHVHLMLKGDVGDVKTLALVHFRMKTDGARNVYNGPRLLGFETDGRALPVTFDLGRAVGKKRTFKAKYLLFLKRRPDGKYEAVTGQTDPVESVKLLAAPAQFSEDVLPKSDEVEAAARSVE